MSAGSYTVYHAGEAKTQEFVDKATSVGIVLGDGSGLNLFGPTQMQALMCLPRDSAELVQEALPKWLAGCSSVGKGARLFSRLRVQKSYATAPVQWWLDSQPNRRVLLVRQQVEHRSGVMLHRREDLFRNLKPHGSHGEEMKVNPGTHFAPYVISEKNKHFIR